MKCFRFALPILLAINAPAFATVTVSSPAIGSTVISPVHYVATATASTCASGVASMGIYVNNKLIYSVKAQQLNTEITLATGAQHTVVEEWDKCGKASYTTVNLTVVTAKPAVSISANPTSIKKGSASVLTVAATNASKVKITGSNGTSYTLGTTGGTQSVSPTATATYTVTATGVGGTTATAKTTVTVTTNPAPTVSISASPNPISAGSSSTLTVTAANATGVTLTGGDGSSYPVGPTGGTQSVSPTATTTYTATATGAGGTSTATVTVTVTANPAPTVSISANPTSIALGNSSTLTVVATNATQVTLSGTDGTNDNLGTSGGKISVSPGSTATYTATATGAGSATATANTQVTVGPKALTSISVSPNPTSFAMGTTQPFTANATYSDNSTADVTLSATWSAANTAVATIDQTGLATAQAAGSTSVTAALSGVMGSASFTVTIAPGTAVNIPTWHGDTLRSGLNAGEQSLSNLNVNSQSFGKLFSYSIHGYAYAQPLLVSGITINNAVHNVLYVATETNDVYAFDADNGNGTPLWHVTIAAPDSVGSGSIKPTIGITSTPVIDTTTNIMYVVSKQAGSGFWLNALDITNGNQVLGGPVNITASVPATNSASVGGVQTLPLNCVQRSALLLDTENVYFGFGSCHTGWMLAYDKTSLLQSGVFNASTVLDGDALQYNSAGGVWMGGGGPASYGDAPGGGDGSVFITTGNGPWDDTQTAWADSVLKFSPPPIPTPTSGPTIIQPLDWFTPQDYQYMDCADGDLASGGLLLIPGTTQALAGAKTAHLYLVDSSNLGHPTLSPSAPNPPSDALALDTLIFEADLGNSSNNAAPFSKNCKDVNGNTWTIQASHYEVYGTSAYFNGSVYLGVTAEAANIPAGVRQFTLSGNTLTPTPSYTGYATDQEIRGTTPFISANGNSGGVLWIIDQNEPLGASGYSPGIAILRAFDPNDLSTELYDSNMNPGDAPGYGIKFTSPIVANGKVYISTGTTLESASTQTGEIDVYGLN